MKFAATCLSILFCLNFLSCAQPGTGTETDPVDSEPDYLDLQIVDAHAALLPSIYYTSCGTKVNFSISIKNNGRAITALPELIRVCIVCEPTSNVVYDAFIADPAPTLVAIQNVTIGMAYNQTLDFSFDDIDISGYGDIGNNYFYALVVTSNQTTSLFLDDSNSNNNMTPFNSDPCVKAILAHASWTGPTDLAGGSTDADAVAIPEFDRWYSSTLSGVAMWYSVAVSTSSSYEVYWDDDSEGTGDYTGDIVVYVYNDEDTTLYGSAHNGFTTPISFTPSEPAVKIIVQRMGEGSFAFGIRQSIP